MWVENVQNENTSLKIIEALPGLEEESTHMPFPIMVRLGAPEVGSLPEAQTLQANQ